jgi:hypothetical protein
MTDTKRRTVRIDDSLWREFLEHARRVKNTASAELRIALRERIDKMRGSAHDHE